MKIPQLVQEIIDYYLYFASWKARIKQLNTEYIGKIDFNNNILYMRLDVGRYFFAYNWRRKNLLILDIHNPKQLQVADLPSRYFYSNTKEQLKSLYY